MHTCMEIQRVSLFTIWQSLPNRLSEIAADEMIVMPKYVRDIVCIEDILRFH